MAGKFFRRIRLVYRRSSNLTKAMVLGMLIVCIVTLTALSIKTARKEQRARELAQQAAVLEQENQTLKDWISILGTVESTIRIAMDELGLILPDSIIFEPVETTDPD